MTDSKILEDLWERAYSGGLREHRKKIDIDQALTQLQAYYRENEVEWYNKGLEAGKNIAIRDVREKIKKALPEKKPIIQHYDDGDNGFDTGWNFAINAILKAIDKEMK